MSAELLDVRPRSRWPVYLAIAAVGGLGVLAGLALRGPRTATPAAAPRTVQVTTTVSAPPAGTTNAAGTDADLVQIATAAQGAAPPRVSTERFAVCERPGRPTGVLPRVLAGVHAVLPSYAVIDVARFVDGAGGLCRVQLRARVGRTVLVLRIVAPIEETHLLPRRQDYAAATTTTSTTQYVRASIGGGWIITAGTNGPAAAAPPSYALARLAGNRELRW